MIVAIDPGVRALGYAIGEQGRITGAGLSRAPAGSPEACAQAHASHILEALQGAYVAWVVLESMVYNGRQRTTPNDLIRVQTVGCLTARALSPTVELQEPTWTTVPKEIGVSRLWGVLDSEETEIVKSAAILAGKTNAKEVLDAARLFVYSEGRANRAGSKIA